MSEQILKIGDCRELIRELPNNHIDCIITSPPYYKMRVYRLQPLIYGENPLCHHEWKDYTIKGTDVSYSLCSKCNAFRGELGWEPTPDLFITHLIEVFEVIKPKLKSTGSLWVNLGDKWIDGDLALIPEQFAIGMKKKGWILINQVIWYRNNHMPESVKRRLTKSYELIYHFVKNRDYFYDLDNIRIPHSTATIQRISQPNVMNQKGGFKQDELRGNPTYGNASRCNKMVQSLAMKYGNANTGVNNKEPYQANNPHRTRLYGSIFSEVPEDCEQFGSPRAGTQKDKYSDSGSRTSEGLHENRWDEYFHPLGKNPGDTFFINTTSYSGSHFAVFPLDLIRLPIMATTPKYICKKCGKIRERIYKPLQPFPETDLSYESKYKGQDIGQTPQGFTRVNTLEREREASRIVAKKLYPDDQEAQQEYINYVHDHGGATRQEFIGYSDCGCNAGFDSGWTLDPFSGSGTVLEFCRKNGYNAIGMELNPTYGNLNIERAMLNVPQIKKLNNVQEI